VRKLLVHKLGRVEYPDGLRLMELAAARLRPPDPPDTDYLFLLEHPAVLTLGRGAGEGNVLAAPEWLERQGFELHHTDRGGDVTYHGPGQVVAYPVVDLADRPDVRRYVAALEAAMIGTCADWGVEAGRHPEHRGAWVGSRKIGAVGVHLSRWITRHGLAFNADPDLRHFQAIVPCGIAEPGLGVTSLARELRERGRPAPRLAEVEERLATHLAAALGRAREDAAEPPQTVSVVGLSAEGKVLLLRRSEDRGGFWQQVTGRVEPGEAPAEAAGRELWEETGAGVPVEPLGYQHAFGVEPAQAARMGGALVARETAFAARMPPGFTPRLGEEHGEWGWFAPAEALKRLRYAGLRRAVRLAVAGEAAR
jgi:lipoyl(octanoyl) transferase